jgi:hypothetical protein
MAFNMRGGKNTVVGEWHPWRLPPQRIHDPRQILARNEQILIEPYPCRVGANSLKQSRQILSGQVGQFAPIERPLNDRSEDRPNRPRMQRLDADVVLDTGRYGGL